MAKYISIGELARLRDISTDTLRYYDRIGLLTPTHIDSENYRRYYSAEDWERLGTIKALQQLGMDLDEIAGFLRIRTPETSFDLLCKKEQDVKEQIKFLRQLQKAIRLRKERLHYALEHRTDYSIYSRQFEKRFFLVKSRNVIKNKDDVMYESIKIEQALFASGMLLPTFASCNYTGIVPKEHVESPDFPTFLAFHVESNLTFFEHDLITVDAGEFLCMQSNSVFWENHAPIQRLMNYIHDNGYELVGDMLQIIQVDDTITNEDKDIVYEFQAPVRKKAKDHEDLS